MSLPKPYYDKDGITIYHADCREILPFVYPDAIVSDPPYPDHESYGWQVPNILEWPEWILALHGFYFWHGDSFPVPYSARHIWSKANRNIGKAGEQYEVCYEVNGSRSGLVMRHAVIDSDMNATLNGDVFYPHPCQKPIRLMTRIVGLTKGAILDPFMGSGTTLVAAKQLGRKCVGIELEEKYCEIAVQRLAQDILPFGEVA
jgi:site-specific DNA-methyltransferase (adenine-specific)